MKLVFHSSTMIWNLGISDANSEWWICVRCWGHVDRMDTTYL